MTVYRIGPEKPEDEGNVWCFVNLAFFANWMSCRILFYAGKLGSSSAFKRTCTKAHSKIN